MAASPTLAPPTGAQVVRARTRPARIYALVVCGVLLASIVVLLLWSQALLILFPETITLQSDGKTLSVTVDGQTSDAPLPAPVTALRLVPVAADHREYQIDGSDTTNNFTFDPAYFARLAATPYYRFQALLRDAGSYSRFRNLVVRGADGRVTTAQATPVDGEATTLPTAFKATVQLERMETPRTIALLAGKQEAVEVTIDRNDKYVRVAAPDDPSGKPLATQYFPMRWQPALAELAANLLRDLAIGLAALLLLIPVAVVMPRWRWRVERRPATFAAVGLAALALAGASYGVLVLFGGLPHIFDGISYYEQGKILAGGALAAATPAVGAAFPTPFFVQTGGRWFSQYPPGAPLALALGFTLGVPWLVEPALAAAAVGLTFAVGRRQYGAGVALLAALLMAVSPFLLLQAGTFMSHVPALACAATALYAVVRYRERPAARWAVLAGAALGLALLCREITAVLYGGALVAWVLPWRRGPDALLRLRHLALAAAVFGVFCLAYLGYNAALTGSAFVLPRNLFNPADRFGFGVGVGFYGQHTLASGLVNTDELLTSLTFMLEGWPYGVALALLALPFVLGRARGADWLHGAIVALFVAAYVGYFYHGIAFGPRYYLEALPAMALLTARGFAAMAGFLARLLARFGRRQARARARNAVALFAAALIACNLVYFLPRQAQLYQGFTGLPGGDGLELAPALRQAATGQDAALRDGLVLTDQWWYYTVFLAPLNCPRLDCATIFAFAPDQATADALQTAYPNRRLFWLEQQGDQLTAMPDAPSGGP